MAGKNVEIRITAKDETADGVSRAKASVEALKGGAKETAEAGLKGFSAWRAATAALQGNFAAAGQEFAKLLPMIRRGAASGAAAIAGIGGALLSVIRLAGALKELGKTVFGWGRAAQEIREAHAAMADVRAEAERAAEAMEAQRRTAEEQVRVFGEQVEALKQLTDAQNAFARAQEQYEKDFARLRFRRDWRTAKNLSIGDEAVRRVALAREEEASAARELQQIIDNTAALPEILDLMREEWAMARYEPGSGETQAFFRTGCGTQVAVINSYNVGGAEMRMYATTVTTTAERRGLSRAEALAMAASGDYNWRDKHGVRYYSGTNKAASAWMYVPDSEGTACAAAARRVNEADMWRVVVTHTRTTVTHSAWTVRENV